uniref:DAP3 binding cell death enhancer 1 n=1 Tax=Pundamilia nyererei TaxID=303518 RepID=A0A3B4EVC6_9CICH
HCLTFCSVLHRYHGNSTLRLSQNHHVEDEVINSSAVLSTSRHSPDNRYSSSPRLLSSFSCEGALHQMFSFVCLQGAAAVLFMQLCRRIHSQFSSSTEPSPSPGALSAPSTLHNCGYHILLEICEFFCIVVRQNQDQSPTQSSDSDSSSTQDQRVEDICVPVVLNIIGHYLSAHLKKTYISDKLNTYCCWSQMKWPLHGYFFSSCMFPYFLFYISLCTTGLENAKRENHQEAFTCFLAAAQQGYSKAQFNVAVCYEKGRGVRKNKEKALHYYRQAAASGHRQAQYRCAKLLLTSRGHQSPEELSTAIDLLEQAAAAGLTKVEVMISFSQRTIVYLLELHVSFCSQDDTAQLFLGNCYESGFVVQQNLRTAIKFYKQAARAGNKQAERLLRPPNGTYKSVLRSIHSAPCFSKTFSPLSSCVTPSTSQPSALPLLPHSWSTGSLSGLPSLSSVPLHLHSPSTERRSCQWTVGIG